MTFLVVIPVRNEVANLPAVVRELRECWPDVEIVVVDDASTDSTGSAIAGLHVRLLRLPQHLGLGGAMRAGLRYAQSLGHEVVVRVDGDGQHRPDQIGHLLGPISDGCADAVQGSRYSGSRSYASDGVRRLGQRLLGLLLSALVQQKISDPTSGFWVFGPRAVRLLAAHHPTGYPEPELLLLLRRNGLRVAEVPVQMRGRLSGRSSLTVPRALVALGRVLLAMVVVPLRAVVEAPARD
ncbi:MAG TPA: glycosyltransferase family 2 protein [Candidatus Tectomicrobia bacterium]|nr:glycosyltransferase family 2 protein [Candidatus Tectomicrobia bacterium]